MYHNIYDMAQCHFLVSWAHVTISAPKCCWYWRDSVLHIHTGRGHWEDGRVGGTEKIQTDILARMVLVRYRQICGRHWFGTEAPAYLQPPPPPPPPHSGHLPTPSYLRKMPTSFCTKKMPTSSYLKKMPKPSFFFARIVNAVPVTLYSKVTM